VNGAEYRLRFGPAGPNASVTVSGRVLTPTGLALRNATVAIISPQGQRRTAITSSFGFFSFPDVPGGFNYTISITSRRYRFASRMVQINADAALGDFIGLE